jgi:hypothetical protein
LAGGGELRSTEGATNEDFRLDGGAFLNRRLPGADDQLTGAWVQDSIDHGEPDTISLGGR